MPDTTELARKLLESKDWKDEGYSLHSLFQIRDALKVLQGYGLADEFLLQQTEKYIRQKGEQE